MLNTCVVEVGYCLACRGVSTSVAEMVVVVWRCGAGGRPGVGIGNVIVQPKSLTLIVVQRTCCCSC